MKYFDLKKFRFMSIKFILLAIFFITISQKLVAQNINPSLNKTNKNVKTTISSDIIDIKKKSQKIDFINNVIVERDDISILANKMTIFYIENNLNNGKENSSSIKEIVANDKVKLFNNELTVNADFARFDPQKNIIILEKNVIVNNGTSIINGNKFIYDLNQKSGFIHGKSDIKNLNNTDNRVTVIIGDDIKEANKIFKK
jgi:lipopolysaccharide transport protein LptA